MSKDSLDHFDHDTDARNHPKFKALRASFGWEGVGRFWALNEMIGAATNARLDLSKKVYRATAAEDLGLTIQSFDEFLTFLSDPEECGLIAYFDGIVTSGKTSENWEALKAYRDKEKARKSTSSGKHHISSGKDGVSSGTPAETANKPAENVPSLVQLSLGRDRTLQEGSISPEESFDPVAEEQPSVGAHEAPPSGSSGRQAMSARQEQASRPVAPRPVLDHEVAAGKEQLAKTTAQDFIRQARDAKRPTYNDFDPRAPDPVPA